MTQQVPHLGPQLDSQMTAFVEHSMSYYPADAVDADIDQQRRWYRAMYESLAAPRAPSIIIKNGVVEGPDGHSIPVRYYQPKYLSAHGETNSNVQVVYFHGGGFVVGNLDSHDDVCAEITNFCGFNLVSVGYRLAPENQYPCDINDCLAMVDELFNQGKKIILVGDSAGATLAACVANARASYTGTQLLDRC